MPTLEERVTALEAAVRDNDLKHRENYNAVRRDIADLGGLTARSFLAVHHQMDRMETRLNGIDARFDAFETRFDRLEATVDSRFASLESDMSAVLKILNKHFGS